MKRSTMIMPTMTENIGRYTTRDKNGNMMSISIQQWQASKGGQSNYERVHHWGVLRNNDDGTTTLLKITTSEKKLKAIKEYCEKN